MDNVDKPVYPKPKLWEMWDKTVNYILPVQKQPEFFTQCMYESNYFSRVKESMYYTTAKRIAKVFRRIDLFEAKRLVKNPEALAKAAYFNHPHLGNNLPGALKSLL